MKSRWGNVEDIKEPEVKVSFNRGDEVAMAMIARWFGLTVKEFKKLIPPRRG